MYTIYLTGRSNYEYLLTNSAIIVYNYPAMATRDQTEKRDVPVRKRVYENLKTAILSGRLSPKERLTEEHLAETLGASRTLYTRRPSGDSPARYSRSRRARAAAARTYSFGSLPIARR